MKKAIFFIALLLVVAIFLLFSFGVLKMISLEEIPTLSYEEYDQGYTVTKTEAIQDLATVPSDIRDLTLEEDTDNYEVSYSRITATSSYENICSYNVNNDILYPGAIVDISTPTYTPLHFDRAPLTISADLESATGIDANASLSATIEDPALSSVRAGIRQIVASNIVDGANLPARYSLEIKEIKSEDDFYMNLGLGVQFKGFKISENFAHNNIKKQTNLVVILKQIYYTISVDSQNAEDFFAWNVTTNTIKEKCGESGIPAYVSSVSYGRIAIISIQTNYSRSEIENVLQAAWNQSNAVPGSLGIDFENTIKSISTDSDTTVNCFIYGGNSDVSTLPTVITGDISSIFSTVFSSYDATSEQCVGLPISYTLRHLNGQLALLQDCQEYVVKNITYKPQKVMSWAYLDKLLTSGDIYNQENLIIDLSSIIAFQNDDSNNTRVENRVVKIPSNIKDFYLKGPNQIISDALAEQLSIEVSPRGDAPLTLHLDGISFSGCDGKSTILGRGQLTLEIQNEVVIYATKDQDAIVADHLTIVGNGMLKVIGGSGSDGSDNDGNTGGIAIRANALTIQDELEEIIFQGGTGGTGAKGYDGDGDPENGGPGYKGGQGGIAILAESIEIQKGKITVIGGSGGTGGNGGKGDDGGKLLDSNGDGGNGGKGGNGNYAIQTTCITLQKNAVLHAIGGNGGDGGNGGKAGTGAYVSADNGSGGNGGTGCAGMHSEERNIAGEYTDATGNNGKSGK